MEKILKGHHEQLLSLLNQINQQKTSWIHKQTEILTLLDALLRSEQGLEFLYEHLEELVAAGLFKGTSWEQTDHLVPSLVKGTLCGGFPMVIYESMNEIRMLKIALKDWQKPPCSPDEASRFLQEAIITSFDLAFHDSTEELRYELSPNSLKRIRLLFSFLLKRMPLDSFKDKLVQEIREVSAQRPLVMGRLKDILRLVYEKVNLDVENADNQVLAFYVNALFHPTARCLRAPSLVVYLEQLKTEPEAVWIEEAQSMAHAMRETGLVSDFQLSLLRHICENKRQLVPEILGLDSHGKAEFERHADFVCQTVKDYFVFENKEAIYGLSRMLNRNLFSRQVVNHALHKLFRTRMHPGVKRGLKKGRPDDSKITAKQLIAGGIIQLLGHPLGIGQGMNPTCQSARGLSMWSKHSPGKLLNMVAGVLASNQLTFRYQGELVSSEALVSDQTFDQNLDPVSVVLVPHLDNIYQQMMQKAMLKFPAQDPHVTVNAAFYGLWIPTGFISCYNQVLNVIQDFGKFVRLFYAAFHPRYNRGFQLVYPVPLGIFITSSRAEFLGFHAISLLRVATGPDGDMRAYFFNPNNDGRQNWGQGINPTVAGNGERQGESSLPFCQLLSRVYAFHYNSFEAESNLEKVKSESEREMVEELARASWGKKYFWD